MVVRSAGIFLSSQPQGESYLITGRVTVQDSAGARVRNATVSITWTLPGGATVTDSADSNRSGLAFFDLTGATGRYTLTINNIVVPGYTFDAKNSMLSKRILVR